MSSPDAVRDAGENKADALEKAGDNATAVNAIENKN